MCIVELYVNNLSEWISKIVFGGLVDRYFTFWQELSYCDQSEEKEVGMHLKGMEKNTPG